jgi:hypothetical protein
MVAPFPPGDYTDTLGRVVRIESTHGWRCTGICLDDGAKILYDETMTPRNADMSYCLKSSV